VRPGRGVIAGAHTIVYAEDAEAARTFFRDVIGLEAVDAGDGWLILALPPGELACHPGDAGRHEFFFMCHDIEATVAELKQRGVEFTGPVSDEGWGLLTRFRVPGAGEIGLYEPRHPSPLPGF
jgi:catechol 2,3-dioxygenase-like lactoylglutathione lyase family enzyme